MADSSEELRRELEEFEQAEASLDSGLESAPTRDRVPGWVKWVVIADLIIAVAVVMIVFAT